jgi:hypothetical protein
MIANKEKEKQTNMILYKLIHVLRSEEQYDYKFGFYLPAVV